jgi:uncharacterized membrane protein SpoIIM required for sporulation
VAVDIDRYIARNEATWARLEDLTRRARRGTKRLEAAEVDELVALYQRTSAHLSYVRSHLREPTLIARLTRDVAAANGLIYGRRVRSLRSVTRFLTLSFPGAVYHCRRYILVATIVFTVPILVLGVWVANNQGARDRLAPRKMREAYIEERFEAYYSDESPVAFFTHVTTNNIQVSFTTLAAGAVSGGLGSVALLGNEGARLGTIAGLMFSEGDPLRFFGFIVPHGALELSAIVIAGAAGMAVGWAAIAPGDRTRADALRDAGQRSITVVIGLMTMFLAAGLIEGFITGRGLPPLMRVGIGVLLWMAYVGYLVTQGRAAAERGITGLLGEQPRTWRDEPDRWGSPGLAPVLGGAAPGR